MTRLNHLALNQCHLNFSTDGAVGIPKKKGGEIPSAIRDSMVLWYDLKKQGATNEAMAADPRIIDHSGNGHHATCYNFAWGGMSGMNGYDVSMKEFFIMTAVDFLNDIRYECKNAEGNQYMLYTSGDTPHAAFKIKVSGLTKEIQYRYSPSEDAKDITIFNIPSDGEYEIPQSYANSNIKTVGFLGRQNGIVIELVPLYPNALVSDGVDDYAEVSGLPILTKEKGYTLVVKRNIISKVGCVCSNRITNGISGAFSFELLPLGVTDSFGSRTIITEQDIPNIFSYQKSQLYNYLSLNTSTTVNEGVENLILFELNPTNIGPYAANIALYSLLLFDRDLTTEEIEWVKNNLMTE